MEIFAKFHLSAVTWPWDETNQEVSTRPQAGAYFLDNTFQVSNVSNIEIKQNDQPFFGYNPEGLVRQELFAALAASKAVL